MLKLRNHLLATAAGAVLAIGVSHAALAQVVFTLNPSAAVSTITTGNITADKLSGVADSLTTFGGLGGLGNAFTPGSTFSESGVLQITAFTDCSSGIIACNGLTNNNFNSGQKGYNTNAGAQYSLFLTFSATGTVNSPTNYTVNTTTYTLFLDTNVNTPGLTLTGDTIPTTTPPISLTTPPAISGPCPSANCIAVASGSLVPGTGSVTISPNTPQFGEQDTLTLNPLIAGFFVSPPNLNIAFSAFTGTQATACGASNTQVPCTVNPLINQVALYQQVAEITLDNVIPEPASMAIFGTALLGLGWARRRKNGSKNA